MPVDLSPVRLVRKRLDAEGVTAHLRALAAGASAIELRVKGGAGQHSDAGPPTLEAAGAQLCGGEVAAIQIRFFQDDAWWTDTLMRVKEDYRLVRMKQEEPPAE